MRDVVGDCDGGVVSGRIVGGDDDVGRRIVVGNVIVGMMRGGTTRRARGAEETRFFCVIIDIEK